MGKISVGEIDLVNLAVGENGMLKFELAEVTVVDLAVIKTEILEAVSLSPVNTNGFTAFEFNIGELRICERDSA